MLGEAIGQLALLVDGGLEQQQLLARGQLAAHQQVRDLLEPETALAEYVLHEVFDIVAAERQVAVNRHLAVVGDDVTVDVGDIGDTRHNARAIGVAQATLHARAREETRVDCIRLFKMGI